MAGLAVAVPDSPATPNSWRATTSACTFDPGSPRALARVTLQLATVGQVERDQQRARQAAVEPLQRRGAAPGALLQPGASRCAGSAASSGSAGRPRANGGTRCPRLLDHRGPDGEGSFEATRRRARPCAARRSSTSRTPACSRSRARTATPAAPQRRDLQLSRAAARAREARPSLPEPPPIPRSSSRPTGTGATPASSTSTACGRSRSGTEHEAALLLARPVRRQAVLLPPRRAPVCVRQRAQAFRADPGARSRAEARRHPRLSRAGLHRSSSRDLLRGHRPASAGPFARRRRRRASPAAATGRSGAARRARGRRSRRSGNCSSTRSACGCGATSRSGLRCRAASTRRRSPAAIDHLLRSGRESDAQVGQRQQTFTRLLRGSRVRRAPIRERRGRRIGAEPHLISFSDSELVDVLPARRRGAGRAVRLDEHRRAVVRDARGPARRHEGDARRTGRRRGPPRVTRRRSGIASQIMLAAGELGALGSRSAAYRRRAAPAQRRRAAALATPFLPGRRPLAAARAARRGDRLVHRTLVAAAPRPSARGLRSTQRLRRRVPPVLAERGTCRSCCATRTATRWRIRSRHVCRSLTTGSSSLLYSFPPES